MLEAGDTTRIRTLYVDSSSARVTFSGNNCGIGNSFIDDGMQRAYRYSLGNGIKRFMLEESFDIPAPFTAQCTMDTDCTATARALGVPNTWQYFCSGDREGVTGTCRQLLSPERVMMTPESIIVALTDDSTGDVYDEALARSTGFCTNPEAPASAEEIGNAATPNRVWQSPTTTGFVRYIANDLDSPGGGFDQDIVQELADCAATGYHHCQGPLDCRECPYDPEHQIRQAP
jgi:hypothetical protein